MHYLGLLAAFAGVVLGADRTKAPPGALVVGVGQKYTTVQAAVNALINTAHPQSIFITPGTYDEQVYVPELAGPVTIFGSTKDTTTYSSNEVTITHHLSQKNVPKNDLTATLRVWTKNFRLYNVNVVNTYGAGSQALALSASAEAGGYYGCQFRGYQDTVLAQVGPQLYANCYIEGATDFIFGQRVRGWFEQCDLRVVERLEPGGCITASGRDANDPKSLESWYVFNHCSVAAAQGQHVGKGWYYLGRPWRPEARVVFQNSYMSDVVNPAGWSAWNDNPPPTHAVFGEFGNAGEGSGGQRAAFATKLGAPIAIADVLGASYKSAWYVDLAYLS